MIKLSQIIKKFKNPARALEYIFGRFYLVRKVRRLYNSTFYGRSKALASQNQPGSTEFSADQSAVLSSLSSEGVFTDLRLTDQTVKELQRLIAQSGIKNASPPWQEITIEDANKFNLVHAKAPILMISHVGKELAEYANQIARDEALFGIAT